MESIKRLLEEKDELELEIEKCKSLLETQYRKSQPIYSDLTTSHSDKIFIELSDNYLSKSVGSDILYYERQIGIIDVKLTYLMVEKDYNDGKITKEDFDNISSITLPRIEKMSDKRDLERAKSKEETLIKNIDLADYQLSQSRILGEKPDYKTISYYRAVAVEELKKAREDADAEELNYETKYKSDSEELKPFIM